MSRAHVSLDGGVLGYLDEAGNQERFHAGRLTLTNGHLVVRGALPDNERDLIIDARSRMTFLVSDRMAALTSFSRPSNSLPSPQSWPMMSAFTASFAALRSVLSAITFAFSRASRPMAATLSAMSSP